MGGKLKHRTSSSREAAPAKPKLSCTCSQPLLPQTRLLACLLSCIEARKGGPHCALCSSASDVTGGAPRRHMFKKLPKSFQRLAFLGTLGISSAGLAWLWINGHRCQELEKCQKKESAPQSGRLLKLAVLKLVAFNLVEACCVEACCVEARCVEACCVGACCVEACCVEACCVGACCVEACCVEAGCSCVAALLKVC